MFIKITENERIDISELSRYSIRQYANTPRWNLNLWWKRSGELGQISFDSQEAAEIAIKKIDEAIGILDPQRIIPKEWEE